jgi:alpha-galactosidase
MSNMTPQENRWSRQWVQAALGQSQEPVSVECLSQGWSSLRRGQSVVDKPICLGGKVFDQADNAGLGTHADSDIVIRTALPAKHFHAWAGVDDNPIPHSAAASKVGFSVVAGGRTLWSCPPRGVDDGACEVHVDLGGVTEFHLICQSPDPKKRFAHADWAAPQVTLSDGTVLGLSGSRMAPATATGAAPPFSFRYDGKPSAELLKQWSVSRTSQTDSQGVTVHRAVYTDPQTKLECIFELRQYPDFPAIKWVVRFRNGGTSDTPILGDIQALDSTWRASSETQLRRSKGSACAADDFLYFTQKLPAFEDVQPGKGQLTASSDRGRSSDGTLPFFNLQDGAAGTMIAVGWTGQWAATFEPTVNQDVRVRAGMELTHLVLHPGEEIRTPSMLVIFWEGDPMRGHNLLRRFILAHNSPTPTSEFSRTPLCGSSWGGSLTSAMLKQIADFKQMRLPFDVYWIDAGWYGDAGGKFYEESTGQWWRSAGNWNIDKSIHPDGMAQVSQAARDAGYKMLLWVEPERAVWGSQMTKEHPDWYLGRHAGEANLLNLGLPEARKWATELVSGLITDLKLSWYRQDFNMPALESWRANDAPDRQGMTEIRHIEGLYAFWDELQRRHPGLNIDNCSSGGRRIDIETLARAIPLWRTDYVNKEPVAAQTHGMGLSYWVPLNGTGVVCTTKDAYKFRSNLSPALAYWVGTDLSAGTASDVETLAWHQRNIEQYKYARTCFYGDYYPLTSNSADDSHWAAYQMHRPDLNLGMIVMFRRGQSPYSSISANLGGLDAGAQYELQDMDTGTKTVRSGKELSQNGTFTIDKPGESRLIFYRKK